MNSELYKSLLPVILLSLCAGTIAIGSILYMYICHTTKKPLYAAISLLGFIGFGFIFFEVLTIASGILSLPDAGYVCHLLQACSAGFFLPALPYFISFLLERSPSRRKMLIGLSIAGLVIALALVVTALVSPRLLLTKRILGEQIDRIWNLGRGFPGPAYRLRDLAIAVWALICVSFLAAETIQRRQASHLVLTFFGAIAAILTGLTDIIFAVREQADSLFSVRIFSFFSPGVTFFIIVSMIGVMKYFVQQNRDIENAMKLKSLGTLAGGIAHDFNNLLTSIVGNISLLSMNGDTDPDTARAYRDMENAAYQAKRLTEQLLTFSKGGSPVRKTTSIAALVEETAQFTLSGSSILTSYRIDSGIWNAAVDPGQISQVIQNIIINAKQAIDGSGSIQIGIRNEPRFSPPGAVKQSGPYVKISIQDSGPGIPHRNLKHIFDPYFSTKKDGNGLGLYICYSIITQHNGYISVRSDSDQGTCFDIYLPAACAETPESNISDTTAKLAPASILVLEDEPAIQTVLEKMLTALNLQPVFTGKGEDTVAAYKAHLDSATPFDLVLLDLTIKGGMGGKETAEAIARLTRGAKIIVCSGYSQDPVMANYRNFGFSGVIKKPYRMKDLREAITEALK
ncbi:MAG: response regulator [Spirochaetales bacterium]|nr:response regulator [Spirochaetales bacterium]